MPQEDAAAIAKRGEVQRIGERTPESKNSRRENSMEGFVRGMKQKSRSPNDCAKERSHGDPDGPKEMAEHYANSKVADAFHYGGNLNVVLIADRN